MKINNIREFAQEVKKDIEKAVQFNEKNKERWEKEHCRTSFLHMGIEQGLYKAEMLLEDKFCELEEGEND